MPASVERDPITGALAVCQTLLRRHGITDITQARRLIQERFTDDELAQWKRARDVLDGNGVIG